MHGNTHSHISTHTHTPNWKSNEPTTHYKPICTGIGLCTPLSLCLSLSVLSLTHTHRQKDKCKHKISDTKTHTRSHTVIHTHKSRYAHTNTYTQEYIQNWACWSIIMLCVFNIISCAGLLNIPLTDFHNNMSTPSISSANIRLWFSVGFRATLPAINLWYSFLLAYAKWSNRLQRAHHSTSQIQMVVLKLIEAGTLKTVHNSSELQREQSQCSMVSINFELTKPGCSKVPLNRNIFIFFDEMFYFYSVR